MEVDGGWKRSRIESVALALHFRGVAFLIVSFGLQTLDGRLSDFKSKSISSAFLSVFILIWCLLFHSMCLEG